jgi:hypothetical protein
VTPDLIIRDGTIVRVSAAPLELGDRVRATGRTATLTHHQTSTGTYRVRYADGTTSPWLTRSQITNI